MSRFFLVGRPSFLFALCPESLGVSQARKSRFLRLYSRSLFKIFQKSLPVHSSVVESPLGEILSLADSGSRMNESDFEVLSDDSRVKPGFRTLQTDKSSLSSSLVLDSERGELVEACVSAKRKMAPAERNVDALRNHSEAERRRRARINAHLDTLRGLVPEAKKMDKAALLAEVINRLRKLKGNAEEAMQQYVIPTDADEIKVEQGQGEVLDLEFETIKASLCCAYRPGLLSNLRQALVDLGLIVLSAEVATLEGRMKSIMVLKRCHEGDMTLRQFLSSSLHLALCSIVDQFSTSEESQRPVVSKKRRRPQLLSCERSGRS